MSWLKLTASTDVVAVSIRRSWSERQYHVGRWNSISSSPGVLQFSDTVLFLDIFGDVGCSAWVQYWVENADRLPAIDADSDHVCVDEAVVHIGEDRLSL